MGLFKRNPNEANFAGGSKNFLESIQSNYQDIHSIYWRDAREDFNTGTTLTVHPGEEAIFEKNGEMIEHFTNGAYELTTENYPFIGRILNSLSGGISSFNCRVHFFRSSEITCNWGTTAPLQVLDPVHDVNFDITANGQFRLKIVDPMLFIVALAGNVQEYNSQTLYEQIGAQYMQAINEALQDTLDRAQEEILRAIKRRREISELITQTISPFFQRYGFILVNFSIDDMTIVNNEQLAAFNAKRTETAGDIYELNRQGDNYGRIQGMKILRNLSVNEGAGGVASAGAGLGMGMAAGSVVGDIAKSVFAPMQQSAPQQPVYQPGNASRFGQPQQQPVSEEDPMEKLGKLKRMLDAGLIGQDEYDSVKSEILKKMI